MRVGAIVTACAALASFFGAASAVRAADAEHWLRPSRQYLDRATIFSGGVPPAEATLAPQGDPALAREGASLYGEHCSSCHGASLAGSQGVPSLLNAGGAAVDFYVTTGRMPLAVVAGVPAGASDARINAAGIQAYHTLSLFDARQTAALETYVNERAAVTLTIPTVRLDPSKLQKGRRLFENNCQACHGAAAQGATAGYQWTAIPLRQATPTQIGEAIRIGPGVMPRFSTAQLSDDDVDAVATYVRYLASEPQTYGGTIMDSLGPVAEGLVASVFGVGLLFWVVYFTGTKADGRRVHERD